MWGLVEPSTTGRTGCRSCSEFACCGLAAVSVLIFGSAAATPRWALITAREGAALLWVLCGIRPAS